MTTELDLTNDGYRRWLRAQRPPFEWFIGLEATSQEALANLGDAHAIDLCVALATAVTSASVASPAKGQQTEEQVLRDLVNGAASKFLDGLAAAHPPVVATSRPVQEPSMGGITERREQRVADEQVAADSGRSLFGRPPDSQREATP